MKHLILFLSFFLFFQPFLQAQKDAKDQLQKRGWLMDLPTAPAKTAFPCPKVTKGVRSPSKSQTIILAMESSPALWKLLGAVGQDRGTAIWRINLDQMQGRYIGETEKNLRRLLSTAEKAGVVLFFDEADALFGKRTDVTSKREVRTRLLSLVREYKVDCFIHCSFLPYPDRSWTSTSHLLSCFPKQ
ncbi:MAG: AAA family ATPase [Bacteroidota bacterium]